MLAALSFIKGTWRKLSYKIKSSIAPTKTRLICLVREENIDAVRECLERHKPKYHSIVEMECQINPNRNVFC